MVYKYEDYNVLGGVRDTIAKKYIKDAKNILDVGCGDGYFTFALGEAAPEAKVLGIDLNLAYIETAKNVKNLDNVSFEVKNFYDVKERYDVVTTFIALTNIEYPTVDLLRFFNTCKELTDRLVICEEFPEKSQNAEQRLGFQLFEEFDYRYFTVEQLVKAAQGTGWELESIEDYATGTEAFEGKSIVKFLEDEIEMLKLDRKENKELSDLMEKYNNFEGKKVQTDALITAIELRLL